MIKRSVDLLIAIPSLFLLSPLMITIAAVIKSTSPGPVFFRQERIGRAGTPFKIYKFRTMVSNAASIGPALTIGEDPRITRFGRYLRQAKLDELPQLLNVVLGHMSLVGPRPELAKYVALYPAAARERILSLRPGITDEAAIEFIEEARVLAEAADPERAYVHHILPRKLEIYERYAARRSLLLDLRILGRTLRQLVLANRSPSPSAHRPTAARRAPQVWEKHG
jgi:lipopolysaccharide/colanic/teichoic acid biosynthesis glycosyltransferase